MTTIRSFTFNATDIQFLLDQLNFKPLFTKDANGVLTAVINWDGTYPVYDASGAALPMLATPALNLAAYGASYASYLDYSGLRQVTGMYNNLLPGQQAWGAQGQDFTRQAAADFSHYLKQALSTVVTALTNRTTLTSDVAKTVPGSFTPLGTTVTLTLNEIDRTITATTTSTSDGHHLVVSVNAVTGTITTETLLVDANGAQVIGTPVVTTLTPTTTLSGGELDPNYHPGLAGKIAAAQVYGQDMASYNPGKSVVDYTPRMISETITTGGHVTYDANGHYQSGDGVVLLHDKSGHLVYYTGQSAQDLKASGFQFDSTKFIDTRTIAWGAAIVDTTVPLAAGMPDGSGGVAPNGGPNLYSGAGYGELAIAGQVDKQNTDSNNVTGFGNHEYFYGNVASIGGNAPNNQFMMLFGQFFDHGLDFISKNGTDAAGHTVTITIPLAVNDPLYGQIGSDGRPTTSITLVRSTVNNTWLVDAKGNVLDGHIDATDPTITHAILNADGSVAHDANGNVMSRAGFDGIWGTADDIAKLGGANGDHLDGATLAAQNPTYINHTSPYIDQSQTYGSVADVTSLLREWVKDPNTGEYVASTHLFDGHKTVAYTDAFGNQTTKTLPTLNELRQEVISTGRTALTWEDVSSDLRHRDAQGHVALYDNAGNAIGYLDADASTIASGHAFYYASSTHAAGDAIANTDLATLITHSSTEPLLLDMNPILDGARINASPLGTAAVAALNADISAIGGSLVLANGVLTLTIPAAYAGPPGSPTVYTGLNALAPWVNFSNFSIQSNMFGVPGMPALSDSVHAAVGELLMDSVGDHYVAGDGRANENFGLTAIHQIWHEEHGFQVQNLEATIASLIQSNQAHIADWQVAVTNTATAPTNSNVAIKNGHYEATGGVLARDTDGNFYVATGTVLTDQANSKFAGYVLVDNTAPANIVGGVITNGINAVGNYTMADGYISWNNDNIFNAAKVTVEMEYQHMAVDQFSRAVSPNIQEFAGVSTARNAAISLEFGQAAYRFGHSSLRETLDTMDPNGGVTGKIMSYALERAFLQPGTFSTVGAGAVVQGAVRQLMNEVDQFVTPAMNEGLLGQPLDLAAINIARGRDTGLPTLNAFKAATGVGQVYASWNAFGQNMEHPEALADFIAAYSFDGDLAKAKTIVDLANLPTGGSLSAAEQAVATANGWTQATATDFMLNRNGVTGADGFNKIDLWIGGLAETHVAGGILGETFDSIFVYQIENLMDGDRFYYLQRLINVDFGNEIQNEQFKDVIERTTGARNLNGNAFTYADQYYDEGQNAKVATGDMVHSIYQGDFFIKDAAGNLVKEFDSSSTGGWAHGGVRNDVSLFDSLGHEVVDLFNSAGVKVFDRSTMQWTNKVHNADGTLVNYQDDTHALFFDTNEDATGHSLSTSAPTSTLSALNASADLYVGTKSQTDPTATDYWHKVYDGNPHGGWVGTNSATTVAGRPVYDLYGQEVTDLFVKDPTTGAPVLVFSRANIGDANHGWTSAANAVTYAGGTHALYFDANESVNGIASATPSLVLLGGDQHKYGGVIADNAAHATFAAGTDNLGTDAAATGVGIYSEDFGSSALNGTIGSHAISIVFGDDTTPGAPIVNFTENFIYDARPDGATTNLDGSIDTGANSAEVLVGTKYNDYIQMGIGDDTAYGGAGNDIIYGGNANAGHNTLYGGDGNDYLVGGDAPDLIDGGNGDDWVFGMSSGSSVNGVDQVIGGVGNDHVFGGVGIDKLFGGQGDDYIYGGQDTDPFMYGGDGNDYMNGGSGQDILFGGNGSDIMDGGPGQDNLYGGNGDDILRPGDLADVAGNGGGSDVLIGGDNTTNPDGSSTDTGFDFADYSQQAGTNGLVGDLANQATVGQLPKDLTSGIPTGLPKATNTGDTWFELEGIIGTKNADVLYGDSASDGSLVSFGNNWLVGGSGADVIVGRGGNDVIIGGSIRLDTLVGKYSRPGGGDPYHSASDYSTNSEGASHRVYDDATLGQGLLDAASTTAGVTFDKRLTDLLKSAAYKDYVLGDGGTDGAVNIAAYSGSQSDYKIAAFIYHDPTTGQDIQAYTIQDLRNGSPDGTDVLVGIQAVKFNFVEATGAGQLVFLVGGPQLHAAATASVDENTTFVETVTAQPNLNGDAITYALTGTDAGLFTLAFNSMTGQEELQFVAPPNFEATAVNHKNLYNVTVVASEIHNGVNLGSSSAAVAVTVTNVNEAGVGQILTYVPNGTGLTATTTSIALSGPVTDGDLVTPLNVPGAVNNSVLAHSYQWQSTNNNGTTWTNITGNNGVTAAAQQATYTPAANATVHLVTTYTDAFGVETVTSQAAQIGSTGANTLNGTTDAIGDLLIGLGGNDTYLVNTATDIVVEAANAGTDSVTLVTSNTLKAYTLTDNVENLTATLEATGQTYTLTGNALTNTITGGAGDDVIDGGAGADTMIGGGGTNTYYVDNVGDRVFGTVFVAGVNTALDAGGTDTVFTSVNFTLTNFVENLTVNSAVTTGLILTGSGQANTITGGIGNDTIDGGAGADTMIGGAGNDTYVVDNVNDVVTELANGGTDTINLSVSAALTSYTLGVNVENLNANGEAGATTYTLNGNALDNIINGGAGTDIISGGAGNDTISGGAGNDTLDGGAGNDTIDGGAGNDTLIGGGGTDTLIGGAGTDLAKFSTATSTASFAINGLGQLVVTTGTDVATLNAIEQLQFGSDAVLTLHLGTGANNSLPATPGAAHLFIGGGGLDTMTGTTGALDIFAYTSLSDSAANANRDVINGFEVGRDKIDLHGIAPVSTGWSWLGDITNLSAQARGLIAAGSVAIETVTTGTGANAIQHTYIDLFDTTGHVASQIDLTGTRTTHPLIVSTDFIF